MGDLRKAGEADANAVPDAPPLPLRRSLRARGLIATLALIAYVAGAAVYISGERATLHDSMGSLERLADHEKAVALAEAAINAAVVDVREISSAGEATLAPPGEIVLYMESCEKLFAALEPFDTSYTLLKRAIDRSYATLQAEPVRANWIDLRESLGRAASELEIRRSSLTVQRDELSRGYHRAYDAVTTESIVLSLLGIAVFGAAAAWFFHRLSRDIVKLEAHARRIVAGARGQALPVNREDELGRLIGAVNRMAVDLDEHEKQIEVDGQRRSHQEKMLAVGALAAGVAHEVNNPLMTISMLAQDLEHGAAADPARVQENARQIATQVQRAALATRHLAEAAAPHATEIDWVDLNAMLRRVVQLMGYDKRWRHIAFECRLDAALPAAMGSANAIQQVLMQVIGMGCDAIGPGRGPVVIESRAVDGAVEIGLSLPVRLDFAQPSVQRTLLLARAIIEPMRGRLAFGQDDSPLLRIKLSLPVDPAGT